WRSIRRRGTPTGTRRTRTRSSPSTWWTRRVRRPGRRSTRRSPSSGRSSAWARAPDRARRAWARRPFSSLRLQDLLAGALARAHRAVHRPVRGRGGLGAGPVQAPHGLAQPSPVLGQGARGEVAHGAAACPLLLGPVLLEHLDG